MTFPHMGCKVCLETCGEGTHITAELKEGSKIKWCKNVKAGGLNVLSEGNNCSFYF